MTTVIIQRRLHRWHLIILVVVDVVECVGAVVSLGVNDLIQPRLQLDGDAVDNVSGHNGPVNRAIDIILTGGSYSCFMYLSYS